MRQHLQEGVGRDADGFFEGFVIHHLQVFRLLELGVGAIGFCLLLLELRGHVVQAGLNRLVIVTA
ncbi:hypothetical protein D3C72_2537170 [compost metagenome]